MVFSFVEVENALGWRVFAVPQEEREKVVSENDLRTIAGLRSGRKMYFLKGVPELSAQEARLVRDVLDEYRQSVAHKPFNLMECLERHCDGNSIILDGEQRQYIGKILRDATRPEGILSELLMDEELEEIAVIGLGKSRPVHVFDRNFGWLATNIYFSHAEEVRRVINAMASAIGRRITLQQPRMDAMLADGSRLNACIEPLSVLGPCITIRKFRKKPITPLGLIRMHSMSAEQAALLWMAMQSDCSVLVCGNTGSGKTTLLNSLFGFVPEHERVILVEDTPELNISQRHVVSLATVDGIGLGFEELITNTLRMRPDRVVVGEIRNAEQVKAFIDTLLAGQGKGSYATFHAQSAREAIARVRAMGVMEQDLQPLDLILVQKRWSVHSGKGSTELRKMVEVSEISWNGKCAAARPVFSFDFARNAFVNAGIPRNLCGKIGRAFGFGRKEFAAELASRAAFLESLKEMPMEDFIHEIGNYGKNNG